MSSKQSRRGTRLEHDDEHHCKKCGWELPEKTANGLCEKCDAKASDKIVKISLERYLGGVLD